MEASALKQRRLGVGMRRSPLLKLQSDERLVTLVRRGNHAAFDALVARYQSRLLAFCRHLLRSREDAEDVLQDVFASAFKAMIADERPISVRPWLYRIARNRCLNHLRRMSAIGVDSIEDHVSDHVPSTSDAVQRREDLWQLVGDIQQLPESQRSALLLREMEALSYEQIAHVMDKTIPSVKSLLIRARRGLAESAEARTLTCVEAMSELGECHLGRRQRMSRVVRRHLGACPRCASLPVPCEPAAAARAFWPLAPLAPVLALRRFALTQFLHGARAGSTATATAAGAGAGAGASTALGGSGTAGLVSAGLGGLAGKAAVGLTAAVIGVAGVAAVDGGGPAHRRPKPSSSPPSLTSAARPDGPTGGAPVLAAAPAASPRRASSQNARSARRRTASAAATTPTTPTTATTPTTPGAPTTPVATPTTATVAHAPGTHSTSSTSTTPGAVTGTVATSSTGPTGGVAPTVPAQPVGTSTAPTTTTTTAPTTTGTAGGS